MEDMTATIKAASDIMDDALVQNLNNFKEKIEASGLFSLENLTLDLNGKVGTVVIPMKQQHMMSDFLNELTELLSVNILYSYNTEKGRVWRSVTYSMPYHDEMYIIGIESQMYGIVEEITVTFFDTLEIMFPWLRDNLESMQSSKEVFLHRQNITELYRIFM